MNQRQTGTRSRLLLRRLYLLIIVFCSRAARKKQVSRKVLSGEEFIAFILSLTVRRLLQDRTRCKEILVELWRQQERILRHDNAIPPQLIIEAKSHLPFKRKSFEKFIFYLFIFCEELSVGTFDFLRNFGHLIITCKNALGKMKLFTTSTHSSLFSEPFRTIRRQKLKEIERNRAERLDAFALLLFLFFAFSALLRAQKYVHKTGVYIRVESGVDGKEGRKKKSTK